MWIRTFIGVFSFALVCSLGHAGDQPKDKPFEPIPKADVGSIDGVWEADIKTADGWNGTLHAIVSLKPSKAEGTPFHVTVAIQTRLKRKTTEFSGSTGWIVITPVKKGKQRYFHGLRDNDYIGLQLQEKFIREQEKELADLEKKKNKDDAEAIAILREGLKDFKKLAAPLQPNEKNTAAYTLDGDTLTIASKGMILPEMVLGDKIRWDDRIVFKKKPADKK